MNRRLILVAVIAVICIIAVSAFLFLPKVELKLTNFQASLENAIVSSGVSVPFVVDANFTVTNTGNKESTAFTIWIDSSNVNYAISRDSILIEPLKAGESRVIDVGGLGRGYPDLTLNYAGQSKTFHFGDEITLTAFG